MRVSLPTPLSYLAQSRDARWSHGPATVLGMIILAGDERSALSALSSHTTRRERTGLARGTKHCCWCCGGRDSPQAAPVFVIPELRVVGEAPCMVCGTSHRRPDMTSIQHITRRLAAKASSPQSQRPSKAATVRKLLSRAKGASLAELRQDWLAAAQHSCLPLGPAQEGLCPRPGTARRERNPL